MGCHRFESLLSARSAKAHTGWFHIKGGIIQIMKNLKKALALVLAAATAFTFAPVSSSAAINSTDDGLTSKAGQIDSIDFSSFTLDPAGTKTVLLKEHNDKNEGGDVKAFRVTINKVAKKDTENQYTNLVTLNTTSDEDHPNENTQVTGSAAKPDESWGTQADPTISKLVYTIPNVAGKPSTKDAVESSQKPYYINGAYATFAAVADTADCASTTTTATIEALDSEDAVNAKVIGGKSEITISVRSNGPTLEITAPTGKDSYVAENGYVKVPYRVINNKTGVKPYINSLRITSEPTNDAAYSTTITPSADGVQNGILKVHVGHESRKLQVVIHADGLDKNGKDAKDISKQSFDLNVTAANGKLRVTYTTSDTQKTWGSDYAGQTITFTDDAQDSNTLQNGVKNIYGKTDTKNTVENGDYTTPATVVADDNGYWKAYGNYIGTNADNYGTASANQDANGTKVSSYSGLTNAAGQGFVSYAIDNKNVLPDATPVVQDGQKTLKINAVTDVSGADVKFSLVAPSVKHDAVVKKDEAIASGKYSYGSEDYTYNTSSQKWSGDFDSFDVTYSASTNNVDADKPATKHATAAQKGDYISYTTAAAEKYGSVSNDGLVTLKNSNIDVPLYVVITVPGAKATDTAAERKTSTVVVPLQTSTQEPLWFYAASENGYSEVDLQNVIKATTKAADHDIILTKDHTSDTIQLDSNADINNYVTGEINTTDNKFSYNSKTHTVSVDTTKANNNDSTTLTIRTLPTPNQSGTVVATFHVVYRSDLSYGSSVKLGSVNVRKGADTSRRQISAAVTPNDALAIFDTNNYYVKDSSRKRGYRKLTAQDDGFNDVSVSASGWVTYVKNAGEVYVRAHAEDSKHAPSGYDYALVTYGKDSLGTLPNTLSVDKKSIVIKAGETATVNATGNTAITVSSADDKVATATSSATVATSAAITVTGVKAGTTTVKVSAAADTTQNIAAEEIEIPVVVTDANGEVPSNNTVKKPAKITGVKVTNLKGGKVKVTWKKQSQKNIKYYVKKTVGKKSSGKSVGSNKTTLSVKKGATVKVKVKAYIYDATGKKLVGSYSKTVTKKTDKK